MRKFLCWLGVMLALYILQASFFPLIYFYEIGPDLLLLLVASFAFLKGHKLGSFMGFSVGLFEDLATGGFFGTNIFIKMMIGFSFGIFSNRVLRDSIFLSISAAALGTIINFILMAVFMLLLGYGLHPVEQIQYKLLPMLFFNILCAWPVYWLVKYINEKMTDKT